MGGYCKGGFSDSPWAIYLSGIGCLIFDDPLTISDFCNLYLWNNDEDSSFGMQALKRIMTSLK